MTPSVVLSQLEETIGVEGSPQLLIDAIEEVLGISFEFEPVQAAEEAEILAPRIRKLIQDKNKEAESTGSISTLSILDGANRYTAGSLWISPSDTSQIAEAKRRRLGVQPVHDAIQKLSFAEFELFGSRILKELGASEAHVTQRSNDQGIDFYGMLSLGVSGYPNAAREGHLKTGHLR